MRLIKVSMWQIRFFGFKNLRLAGCCKIGHARQWWFLADAGRVAGQNPARSRRQQPSGAIGIANT